MKKAPDKKNGEDGLPIPPYAVYNIGNQNPENLLDFVCGPVIDREKTEDGNYASKRIGKESG